MSTAHTFPHILVPIWSLSLPRGVFSPATVLGASASAPIKAHHRFCFKENQLPQAIFFVFSNLVMLLTTCSAEPYAFHKRRSRSNIVLVLYSDRYSKAGPNFSGENGPPGPLFLEFWSPGPIFSPDQNFRDRSSRGHVC